METFPLAADKIVKQLRWLMVCAIIFDFFITLLGQPATYWNHPETADEGNRLFRYFMVHGLPVYLPFLLFYISVAFLVGSMGSKRGALIGIFSYILGHYYGACSWLTNRWHLGAAGFIVYGIVLASVLVSIIFPSHDQAAAR